MRKTWVVVLSVLCLVGIWGGQGEGHPPYAEIRVIAKEISLDGVTWYDADDPPGLVVPVGTTLYFRFTVENTGNVWFDEVRIRDSVLPLAMIYGDLAPGERWIFSTYPLYPWFARRCLNPNVATAEAFFEGERVEDNVGDPCHYFGVDAYNDAYSVNEDERLIVGVPGVPGVLANDCYLPGWSLEVVTGVRYGTLQLEQDGSFTYEPNRNWWGMDSFVYRLCTHGICVEATVWIIVHQVDDPVDAVDDFYATDEDSTLTIPAPGVLENDSYPEGFGSLSVVDWPDYGTLKNFNQQDGSFTYEPNPNWNGTDMFVYRLCDTDGDCDIATVWITVYQVNDLVDAVDDSYTTPEDTTLTVPAPGVLRNDSYPDGFGSLTVVDWPDYGTLNFNQQDGSFTYEPNPNWHGTDTFIYQLCDVYPCVFDCDTATVTIIVNPVNDPPVAQDDQATVPEDESVRINVLANDYDVDGDRLFVSIVIPPTRGSVTVNLDGTITYTPNPNFCGPDSFVYKACEIYNGTVGACDEATVTITVHCVNDPPVAQDDQATVPEDESIRINVLANDYDVDGDRLSVSIVTPPTRGSVTVNPDGTITYTPNPNFCGQDSFVYKACEIYNGTVGACDEATVTITVTCVADPPVAQDDAYITLEDTPLVIGVPGVLGNDYDVDGDLLRAVLVSGPAFGRLDLNANGSFTYTPPHKFWGSVTFTYQVFDGTFHSNLAVVRITVAFVNDPMETEDVILWTCVNEAARFTVTVRDLDILWDGFTDYPITFTLVSGPAHGTVTADWANVVYEAGKASVEIVYAPEANFVGDETFVIRAADPHGEFVLITVRITVERCGVGPAGAPGFVLGPVVIHEIAWAGTNASPEDEWIELLNVSDSPVDLTGWTLRWRKKNPQTPEDLIWREIRLTGVIEPYGFFLLERGDDKVVRDIQADLVYPRTIRLGDKEIPLLFSNEGDIVKLLDAEGQVVDTANADPRVENWAAGSAAFATMERRSPLLPDNLENWWTNTGAVVVGADRNEELMRGTARALNEPQVFTLAGETLMVERGQKVELSRSLARAAEKARVVVVRGDVLGGTGALVPFAPEIVVVRYAEPLRLATITVDTKGLEPDVYTVVVILDDNVYVVTKVTIRLS